MAVPLHSPDANPGGGMDQVEAIAPAESTSGTVRCFGCRNRVGLEAALVLDAGVVCCRRCWERRDALPVLHRCGAIEVVG
jgi:hypothetical protein